ncbi:hypothetical protein H4R35_003712 [Dimargaris xerosporica]|nr:hypothetical protein H4R35_003712 [Dimargaris xerosporica]
MGRHKRTTREVLETLPLPHETTECVARVLGAAGGNLHRVQMAMRDVQRINATAANASTQGSADALESTPPSLEPNSACPDTAQATLYHETLCQLPTRFRNIVFVKRGSYVIVDLSTRTGTKIGGEITHVLYDSQIHHIKKHNLWPTELDLPITATHQDWQRAQQSDAAGNSVTSADPDITGLDCISNESAEDSDDDPLLRNPNRPAYTDASDSNDDSESE